MPRTERLRKKRGRLKPPPDEPQGMQALLGEYLEWMRATNYAWRTVEYRRKYVGRFIAWCAERGVSRPGEVTRPILERYRRELHRQRKKDGSPLSFTSQNGRLSMLRAYFGWLARQNHILYNPAADLELPRPEKRLPKHVLTASEVERVLNQPDATRPLGVRDRAILETFYSTGMRRSELIGLREHDLDFDRGTVMIRRGKGKRDRVVPIGKRAEAWMEKYLGEVRPELVCGLDDGTLFLTYRGERFTESRLSLLVRNYVKASGIGKSGACHLLRHTMATLMLENGADIRFIQQMLGHEDLRSTQIYTRVSIRLLKQVHDSTHPGARLKDQGAQENP